jgi:hypothetical protein
VLEGRRDVAMEVTTDYPKEFDALNLPRRVKRDKGVEFSQRAFRERGTSSEILSTAKLHTLFENCTSIALRQNLQAHLFQHISSSLIIHENTSLDFEQSPLLR